MNILGFIVSDFQFRVFDLNIKMNYEKLSIFSFFCVKNKNNKQNKSIFHYLILDFPKNQLNKRYMDPR